MKRRRLHSGCGHQDEDDSALSKTERRSDIDFVAADPDPEFEGYLERGAENRVFGQNRPRPEPYALYNRSATETTHG